VPHEALVLPTEALTPPQAFIDKATELGIEFEGEDLRQLGLYLAHLLAANERFNLTAIKTPDEAWMRHILDALTLLPFLADIIDEATARGETPWIIDIGSGGGVPGVPLAIVTPTARFTLLEPTGKKAEFLRQSVQAIGLGNVDVICDRAEKRSAYLAPLRDKFDAAVVRAVGHLAEIAELSAGFVRIGGVILAVKGERAEKELAESAKAIEVLCLAHAGTHPTSTSTIVALVKSERTPKVYPRHDGEPKRRPLGLAVEQPKPPTRPKITLATKPAPKPASKPTPMPKTTPKLSPKSPKPAR
jgi:16S rRNA (guanine527-N7)-methyltransferase